MKANYHYEYYLRYVDLCNGSIKKRLYLIYSAMRGMKVFFRGQRKVYKVRVYNKNMSEIKEQLEEQLSNLKYAYNELHDDIEWAGLTESYKKASTLYQEIEKLEKLINSL